MVRSEWVRHMVGLRKRFVLGCPLSVAKLNFSLKGNLRSFKTMNWEGLEDEPPSNMAFTLSEFCNARCTFCCHRLSTPRHTMSNEVFFKAAGEYHDMGGRRIWLNAMTGEPLLDPLFFEKMKFIRSLGGFDSVNLTTNGILLNKDQIVESIIDSGINRVLISTAGFEKATYEKYMGVERYNEFLSGLIKMLKRNQESGSPIKIQLEIRGVLGAVETTDFHEKVLPLLESNNGNVKMTFLRFYTDWLGQVKEDDLPERCGLAPRIRMKSTPCSVAFNIAVLANGDLRLCNCHYSEKGRVDELKVGNIMDDALSDVWSSERTKEVRRTTYGPGSNELCRKCLLYYSLQ